MNLIYHNIAYHLSNLLLYHVKVDAFYINYLLVYIARQFEFIFHKSFSNDLLKIPKFI